MFSLLGTLQDPKSYYNSIDKLITKYESKGVKSSTVGLNGIHYEQLRASKKQLANSLANAFKSLPINFANLTEHKVLRGSKIRTVYTAPTLEDIADSTIAQTFMQKLKDYGLPGVYGFFAGFSPVKAMTDLANILKNSEINEPWYVLQSDIVNYTDSIPVGKLSPLWPKLDIFWQWCDPSIEGNQNLKKLLINRLRPRAMNANGCEYTFFKGVPMGRATSSFVAAFYLRELDCAMTQLENAHYFRYGDDILFLTQDKSIFTVADKLYSDILLRHQLTRHPKKDQFNCLTRSGFNYPNDSRFKGTSQLTYLGLSINRCGQISLAQKHISSLKQDIASRIKSLCHSLKHFQQNEKVTMLIECVNYYITQDCKDSKTRLGRFFSLVNDRGVLKDIDYFIAQSLSRELTGIYNCRSFRKLSYATLRKNGLKSLCLLKNTKGQDI